MNRCRLMRAGHVPPCASRRTADTSKASSQKWGSTFLSVASLFTVVILVTIVMACNWGSTLTSLFGETHEAGSASEGWPFFGGAHGELKYQSKPPILPGPDATKGVAVFFAVPTQKWQERDLGKNLQKRTLVIQLFGFKQHNIRNL